MSWPLPMHPHKRKKAIYSLSVPAPPGSFLPHPQISAECNEGDHISPSYSPPPNSLPENQQSDIWNKWAFALPKRANQRSSCSCKEKILPIRVTGICKSVCALHRFLSRAPDNFVQVFVKIVATAFSFYFGHTLKCITWKTCFSLIQYTTVSSTAIVPTIETQHCFLSAFENCSVTLRDEINPCKYSKELGTTSDGFSFVPFDFWPAHLKGLNSQSLFHPLLSIAAHI